MRWLAVVLFLLLLGMQYRLWVGEGSLAELRAVRDEIAAQKRELEQMRSRNQTLGAEVLDLREGLEALEERARSELGMIKQGEMFLQVIEELDEDAPEATAPATDGQPPAEPDTGDLLPPSGGDGGLARREISATAGRKP